MVHSLAPAAAYFPTGQISTADVSEVVGQYAPDGQAKHDPDAADAWYVPAAQGLHPLAPTGAYCPAPQIIEDVDPTTQKKPAGHGTQDAEPASPW